MKLTEANVLKIAHEILLDLESFGVRDDLMERMVDDGR